MNWVIVEVALGLVLVYLVVSLIASGINEAVASIVNRRGTFLKKGVERLLGSKAASKFFDDSLIKMISADRPLLTRIGLKGVRLPSYMEATTFADAAASVLTEENPAGLDNLPGVPGVLWRLSEHDRKAFRTQLVKRFNEVMDRVSEWYKRRTRFWLITIGFVLALLLNVDTVLLAETLWKQPNIRAAVAAQAAAVAAAQPETPTGGVQNLGDNLTTLRDLPLPLGWTRAESQCVARAPQTRDSRCLPDSIPAGILKLAGILMTAIAVSFGAPFWFDLLGRIVQRNIQSPSSQKTKDDLTDAGEDQPANAAKDSRARTPRGRKSNPGTG